MPTFMKEVSAGMDENVRSNFLPLMKGKTKRGLD